MTDVPAFYIGDKVLLDSKVLGRVDGFYRHSDGETSVVVKLDWGWSKHVWGAARGQDLDGEEVKLVAYSMILVHISNLSRPKE